MMAKAKLGSRIKRAVWIECPYYPYQDPLEIEGEYISSYTKTIRL